LFLTILRFTPRLWNLTKSPVCAQNNMLKVSKVSYYGNIGPWTQWN
jgi:hypothetical protein